MFRTTLFLVAALVITALAMRGQNLARREQGAKSVHISKVADAHVRVDGKLDEPVWRELPAVSDFIQTDPDQGAPATERTEAVIFYDDNAIYFGVRCYDSEPDKVIARYGAHDGRTNSDSVDIFIDTFHDRRTGYYFSINSRGIQWDAISNEGSGEGFQMHDSSWDGIWYSASTLQSWGWSIEVMIPFKSIRLSRGVDQIWGLNIGRDLVRKNERSYWSPVTRYDGTMKPSKAGSMTGLENVKVGRNLELIPFFTAKYRRTDWQPELNGPSAIGGLDARYGLSANLTATMTVNPDFGETEADEITSQISRFEIFFPEKRKFFTEGANYFSTPMSLFFSRRVGAPMPDGEPQRILEGGKVTGKSGPWTLGLLQAVTAESEYVDPADGVTKISPRALFGVVRVQHDLFSKSAIGFISVNRVQDGGTFGQHESSHGIDLHILKGENISWSSQVMVNTSAANPGIDGQHLGWVSEFNYNSDLWDFGMSGKFLGRKVDMSYTGYEPEVDRWSGDAYVGIKPFINRWGIRQIFTQVNYDEANGTRGELEDAGADASVKVQFKNFWVLDLEHSYDRVRFNLFTPEFQALAPTRVYTTPQYRVMLSTNENRRVYLYFKFVTGKLVQFRENFYGGQKEYTIQSSMRVNDHLRWELSGTNVRETLMNGRNYQDRRYLISRWNYQFTPKLRARVLAQYFSDIHGKDFSVNSLIAYDFTARSALFVGYNRQRHIALDPTDLGHVLFVKLSYLFAF